MFYFEISAPRPIAYSMSSLPRSFDIYQCPPSKQLPIELKGRFLKHIKPNQFAQSPRERRKKVINHDPDSKRTIYPEYAV